MGLGDLRRVPRAALDRLPKGLNVGGMVGHCAVRYARHGRAQPRRGRPPPPTTSPPWPSCVDEAIDAGALGFSTVAHAAATGARRPPGARHVRRRPTSCCAIGDVLGRHGRGVFESAHRGSASATAPTCRRTRAEVGWMGEVSRRSGPPGHLRPHPDDRRPDLYRRVLDFVNEENAAGATVRPQTTARGIGVLFGLGHRTPFDRRPAWQALRDLPLDEKLAADARPGAPGALIDEAEAHGARRSTLGAALRARPHERACPLRPTTRPTRLAAQRRARRGIAPAEAFIDLVLETRRRRVLQLPVPQPETSTRSTRCSTTRW